MCECVNCVHVHRGEVYSQRDAEHTCDAALLCWRGISRGKALCPVPACRLQLIQLVLYVLVCFAQGGSEVSEARGRVVQGGGGKGREITFGRKVS